MRLHHEMFIKAKGLARKLPSTLTGIENNRTNPSIVIEKQPLLSTTMGSSPLLSSKRLLETFEGENRAERKLLPSVSASYIVELLQ